MYTADHVERDPLDVRLDKMSKIAHFSIKELGLGQSKSDFDLFGERQDCIWGLLWSLRRKEKKIIWLR